MCNEHVNIHPEPWQTPCQELIRSALTDELVCLHGTNTTSDSSEETQWRRSKALGALQQHWEQCSSTGSITAALGALQQHWEQCSSTGSSAAALGALQQHWEHYSSTGSITAALGALKQHWEH